MKTTNRILFTDKQIEEATTKYLKKVYLEYTGLRSFPVCKPYEFYNLLDCAKSDLENDGRVFEEEVYAFLVDELILRIRMCLFGQWATMGKSYRHPENALDEVRRIFRNEKDFFNFLHANAEEVGEFNQEPFQFQKQNIMNYKYVIYAVFTGVIEPRRMEWGS